MADLFRQATPGSRLDIPAQTWNALLGMARAQQRPGHASSAAVGRGDTNSIEILVRNDSGGNIPIFGVVQIGEPLVVPVGSMDIFQTRRIYGGDLPSGTDVIYGVTQEPIAEDGIGRVVVAGITPVTLTITDADDTHADATAASAELTTGTSGTARILWKESGTGAGKRGVIQLLGVGYASYNGGGLLVGSGPQYCGRGARIADSWECVSPYPAESSYPYRTARVSDGIIELKTYIDADNTHTAWIRTDSGTATMWLKSAQTGTSGSLGYIQIDATERIIFNAAAIYVGSDPGASGTDGIGNTFSKGFCTATGSTIDGGTW
jgi:hypothetical protein